MEDSFFKASDIKKIRGLGDTEAGKLLIQYMDSDIERAMKSITFNVDAENNTEIAAIQSSALTVRRYKDLLTRDVEDLLEEEGLEDEDE